MFAFCDTFLRDGWAAALAAAAAPHAAAAAHAHAAAHAQAHAHAAAHMQAVHTYTAQAAQATQAAQTHYTVAQAPAAPAPASAAASAGYAAAAAATAAAAAAAWSSAPCASRAATLWAGLGASAPLPLLREARIKIHDVAPGSLSPALAPALADAWCRHEALSLEGHVRPGCTLLTLDALIPALAVPFGRGGFFDDDVACGRSAPALARALLASPAGAWLRRTRFDVRCGRSVAAVARGGVVIAAAAAAAKRTGDDDADADAPPLARLPPLRPFALLSTSPATLSLRACADADADAAALRCRLHGHSVSVSASASAPACIALPATCADGVALLTRVRVGADGHDTLEESLPRAILLTRDAEIANEVSSGLDALVAAAEAAPGATPARVAAAEAQAARVVAALGHALRPEGGCSEELLAVAAAEALARGWEATAAALLPRLAALRAAERRRAAAASSSSPAARLPGWLQSASSWRQDDARAAPPTLVHAAARGGCASLVALTLRLGGADALFGTPQARAGADGITPLHLAAAASHDDRVNAAALVTALTSHSPAATLAWFTARTASGATPAAMALGCGVNGGVAAVHKALVARMAAARVAARISASRADNGVSDEDAPREGTEDATAALARALLAHGAPVSPVSVSAPCGVERWLYDAHRFRERRLHALTMAPLVMLSLAHALLRGAPPALDAAQVAALLAPAAPSWAAAWRAYQPARAPFLPLTAVANAALLALALLPRLRPLYARRAHAVLLAYTALMFFFMPVASEVTFRMRFGRMTWPSAPSVITQSLLTVHLAAMPLPLRSHLWLVGTHWALIAASRLGAPIWPQTASLAPFAANSACHALAVAFLVAQDGRAWARWRRARRRRVAGKAAKQA
jgi:hypothetical protein